MRAAQCAIPLAHLFLLLPNCDHYDLFSACSCARFTVPLLAANCTSKCARPCGIPQYQQAPPQQRPTALTPTAQQHERAFGKLPTVMLIRDPVFARWVRSFDLRSHGGSGVWQSLLQWCHNGAQSR